MSNILVINSAEADIQEYCLRIQEILSKLDVPFQTINYSDTNNVNVYDYSGIIISGSPQGDDIVEHHQPFFKWVNDYEKPVLGICAGHHIIGYMFGAMYLRGVEAESGEVEIEIINDDPIWNGLSRKIIVRQMHNDSISVPDSFIHLAKSENCENQAMKHPHKSIYTFQFHPEYLNHAIINNFVEIVLKY